MQGSQKARKQKGVPMAFIGTPVGCGGAIFASYDRDWDEKSLIY